MERIRKKTQKGAPRRRQVVAESRSGDKKRHSKSDLEQRYAFQRNRTLTGSVSSIVSATSELNAELRSPRVHAHQLVSRRRQVGLSLFGIIFLLVCLYGLMVQFAASASFAIKDMPEYGVNAAERYAPVVDSYYAEHPMQRLGFLFNKQQFMLYVQSEAREVSAIDIERSLVRLAHISFTVHARKPVVSWTVDGTELFVDGEGVAFEANYYNRPSVRIVDESGIPASEDRVVASNRFLGFVGRLVEFTNRRGYIVEQVIIPAGTTRQVDLRIKGVKYIVRCLVDRPAGVQAEDLDRAVTHLKARGESPAKYVDIRVAGRAYYK